MFATGGDGLATAFSTASDALEAAVDAQRRLAVERWSEPVGLRVRMAVHTGVADERGGDYFGPTLNRTARLMAAARGGQILVSSATERLLQDRADAGWSLIELGEVRLKDLTLPERAPLLPEADNLAAAVAFAITAKDAVSLARLLGGGGEMWAHVAACVKSGSGGTPRCPWSPPRQTRTSPRLDSP